MNTRGTKSPRRPEKTSDHRVVSVNRTAWRDHGTLVTHGISTGYLAAKHFGLDEPWAERAGEQAQCRFCQKAIKGGIWRCNRCQAILDWRMAYDAGYCTKEEMNERLGIKAEKPKSKEVEL